MAQEKQYKVKVTIGDATIEIEGENESGVAKIVESLRGVLQEKTMSIPVASQSGPSDLGITADDIRSFFEDKKPKNHLEAAATAAFFLRYLETPEKRREAITAEVMLDEFRKANWKLPVENLMKKEIGT